ncbi:MAG: hypothetical protein JWN93_3100 [Hyphomicrobiales bacterium]|nr:hypothetical protein [Hyphomicrobiales bacterium]
MCGELEDDGPTRIEELRANAFLVHARALLAASERAAPHADPLIASIDKLFADALARAMRDCDGAPEGRGYDMLSMQPLAFARLAGLLAAHLSPGEDPLRRVIEALMHGYAEADRIEADHGHDHGPFGHSH